ADTGDVCVLRTPHEGTHRTGPQVLGATGPGHRVRRRTHGAGNDSRRVEVRPGGAPPVRLAHRIPPVPKDRRAVRIPGGRRGEGETGDPSPRYNELPPPGVPRRPE